MTLTLSGPESHFYFKPFCILYHISQNYTHWQGVCLRTNGKPYRGM